MDETDIFDRCIQKLNKVPGIKAVTDKREFVQHFNDLNTRIIDAKIDIETITRTWKCMIEIKQRMTEQKLWLYQNEIRNYHAHGQNNIQPLLFTDYVRPRLADYLKKNDVNFVDAAGNMLLHLANEVYVFVKGERLEDFNAKKKGNLAQAAGLKVLYVLLQRPEAVDWTIRRLAHDANVGIATVKRTVDELKADGFVEQIAKDKKLLTGKQKLLERWVVGYAEVLRPKLVKGRFRTQEKDLAELVRNVETNIKKRGIPFAVTGAFAEDLLVHHYIGNDLTFFIGEWNINFERDLRWLPAKDGNITVLKTFGEQLVYETIDEVPITAPLLTYTELLATGGERARDAADIIYRRFIEGVIRET